MGEENYPDRLTSLKADSFREKRKARVWLRCSATDNAGREVIVEDRMPSEDSCSENRATGKKSRVRNFPRQFRADLWKVRNPRKKFKLSSFEKKKKLFLKISFFSQ